MGSPPRSRRLPRAASCCLAGGSVGRRQQFGHLLPDFRFGFRPDTPTTPQLPHQMAITHQRTKRARGELGSQQNRFDVRKEALAHMATIMCERSHSQVPPCVIYRPFPGRSILCDQSPMHDAVDMGVVKRNLQRAMKRAKIGARPLAERAGIGQTAVRDILEGHSENPRIGTLSAIANALNMSFGELVTDAGVAVVGRIGAGGSIIFEDVGDFGYVPRPPDTDGDLIGLEVDGESMLPKFDPGDVVYISRVHDGLFPNYLGAYCACRLLTGETYLKILTKGTEPGKFTLRSLNAVDIEDVELEWATPIRAILPRFARGYS
jgi:repressor LexA